MSRTNEFVIHEPGQMTDICYPIFIICIYIIRIVYPSRMIRYLPSYIHKCISIFTNHSKFQPGGLTAIYCSAESRMYDLGLPCTLTTLPLDKMAAISQTIFSNAFSWMKPFVFWLQCHWSLFLMIHWTITIIGLVNGFGAEKASHYQNQCWPSSLTHISGTRGGGGGGGG